MQKGEIQQGRWVEDKIDGYGRVLFSTGDVYEGGLVKRMKHGYGTYKKKDSKFYSVVLCFVDVVIV